MELLLLLALPLLAFSLSGGDHSSDPADSPIEPTASEGSQGNDSLFGTDGADTLQGLGGDDFINGFAGDDRIEYDDGNDSGTGGAGNDVLYGGNGNDAIVGGGGDDLVYLGNGDDLYANFVDQDPSLSAGNDTIYGGNGNDTIDDTEGQNFIYGGAGNDVVFGDGEPSLLDGGTGDDTLYGGSGVEVMTGDAGDDLLVGSNGDFMDGGAGSDQFEVDWTSGDDPVQIVGLGHLAGETQTAAGDLHIILDGPMTQTFDYFTNNQGINVQIGSETVAVISRSGEDLTDAIIHLTASNGESIASARVV